jgi:hypothetical protein
VGRTRLSSGTTAVLTALWSDWRARPRLIPGWLWWPFHATSATKRPCRFGSGFGGRHGADRWRPPGSSRSDSDSFGFLSSGLRRRVGAPPPAQGVLVAAALLFDLPSTAGDSIFDRAAIGRGRLRSPVAPGGGGDPENAGAPSLPARPAHLGRVRADWDSDRALCPARRSDQVQPTQTAKVGLGWDLCLLHCSAASGCSPQGFTAFILAITFLSGVNLFFLGSSGICWASLRRSQGPPSLRRSQDRGTGSFCLHWIRVSGGSLGSGQVGQRSRPTMWFIARRSVEWDAKPATWYPRSSLPK